MNDNFRIICENESSFVFLFPQTDRPVWNEKAGSESVGGLLDDREGDGCVAILEVATCVMIRGQ